MRIDILYFDGCPNHELAERRVQEVLSALGVEADIVRITVEDDATAARLRFPGSPTIRVNGVDVAPGADQEPYTMRCRVYPTSSGLDGAPGKDAIRAAIEKSAA